MLLSCAMETSLADARAPHFPALRWSPGIGRRGERVTRQERRDEARENVQPIAARNPANPHERENLPYQGNAPCVPVRGRHRQSPVACAAARFDRSNPQAAAAAIGSYRSRAPLPVPMGVHGSLCRTVSGLGA